MKDAPVRYEPGRLFIPSVCQSALCLSIHSGIGLYSDDQNSASATGSAGSAAAVFGSSPVISAITSSVIAFLFRVIGNHHQADKTVLQLGVVKMLSQRGRLFRMGLHLIVLVLRGVDAADCQHNSQNHRDETEEDRRDALPGFFPGQEAEDTRQQPKDQIGRAHV